MHKLKNMLYEELKKYEDGGELSVGSLDIVHKITDTIKNIYKIESLSGHSERSDYSRDGDWMARGSYDDDSSYRHRDRMGRYSREGDRDHRYSEAKDYMMTEIEEMMHNAKSPREREILKKCMSDLKNGD